MQYPRTITLAFGILCLIAPSIAHAALDGHTYIDPAAQVSFQRPDATWELREKLPLRAASAAFVSGGMSSAAVLLHEQIEDRHIITDASNFAARRDDLAEQIAQMSIGRHVPIILQATEFDPTDSRITFDLQFTNNEPERGQLTNWVRGFIIRNESGQQIYAIRCATSPSHFGSWESQFERVMGSLNYNGQVLSPIYTSRPIPTWWWFAGGAGLFLLAGLFRGRREPRQYHIPKAPRRPVPQDPAATAPDMHAPFPPVDDTPTNSDLPPVDLASAHDGQDAVPDIVRLTAGGMSPDTPIEDFMHSPDALRTTTQSHPDVAPAAGYWTCKCGRKNPNSESFCSRCNADRG